MCWLKTVVHWRASHHDFEDAQRIVEEIVTHDKSRAIELVMELWELVIDGGGYWEHITVDTIIDWATGLDIGIEPSSWKSHDTNLTKNPTD